jgi:hypothetical protein
MKYFKFFLISYLISFVIVLTIWIGALYFISEKTIGPYVQNGDTPLKGDIYWKVALVFSLFMSLFPAGLLTMGEKSYKVWDTINDYQKQMETTTSIVELERIINELEKYRNSMACFSTYHMKGANRIIYAADIKIRTIKHLANANNSTTTG